MILRKKTKTTINGKQFKVSKFTVLTSIFIFVFDQVLNYKVKKKAKWLNFIDAYIFIYYILKFHQQNNKRNVKIICKSNLT